jgi:hypothetical protein
VVFYIFAPHINHHRGLMVAVSCGFLTCLRNFWITPFMALVTVVLYGKSSVSQWIVLTVAILIILILGPIITWLNQIAFKYAQASNVIPLAQIPIQVAPILVYFFIFSMSPPNSISTILLVVGSILTIIAGFLLGRRKEAPFERESASAA